MARRPRHDYPGASYHVTMRGNNRSRIQHDDIDCGVWHRTTAKVVRRYCWDVLAYCLLTNHFHLVVRTPIGGLSDGMCLLNGGYARHINARHGRIDHVFGRRFWSKPIGTRAYLLGSLHYVAWNPVEAGLAEVPESYRWSSHAAVLGLREAPSFLAVDAVLEVFDADQTRARAAYSSYVANRHVPVPGTVTRV